MKTTCNSWTVRDRTPFFLLKNASTDPPAVPRRLPGNIGELSWTVQSGSTRSSNTGPDAAIQGSYYMYTEASGSSTLARLSKEVFFLK